MGFYNRFTERLNQTPQFWILDTGIAAVLVGLLTWSWPTFLTAFVLLILCLSAPRLRRYYLITWTLCWVVIWWQFVAISRGWLAHAQGAIERLPLYVVITISGFMLLRWMFGIFVSQGAVVGAQSQEPRPIMATSEKQESEPNAEEQSDPYKVFGVTRAATAAEIKSTYKHLMSLYHPDKVSHLGEKLQDAANEQSRKIQRAYEILRN